MRTLVIALLLAAAGCRGEPVRLERGWAALGHEVQVEVYASTERVADQLLTEMETATGRITAVLDPFDPDSELNRLNRQATTEPVHTWALAEAAEVADWRPSYERVGQFMTTDLFTLRPGDIVDLAANVMDWERIRHVPVEDDEGRLVGIITDRILLRLLAKGYAKRDLDPVLIRDVMKPDPRPGSTCIPGVRARAPLSGACLVPTRLAHGMKATVRDRRFPFARRRVPSR